MATKVISVDLWSDFADPWCWIAKRRLDRAIADLAAGYVVEANYRSFRVAPESAPQLFTTAQSREIGGQERALTEIAQAEGLNYRMDTAICGDTLAAHCLMAAAKDIGRAAALYERINSAVFAEGTSIYDQQQLVKLAMDVGIDPLVAQTAIDSSELQAAVKRDEAFLAGECTPPGVPLIVVEDRFAISGIQSVLAISAVLDRGFPQGSEAFCAHSARPKCARGAICA